MRIGTNITALIANKNLAASNDKLSASMEKLSSGYRINRAADDSAGMAIASKLRTQIKGLEQSSRNASDGISVVQTAEGALSEIEAILQRMRELAVQGANGSLVDEDRDSIQSEIEALSEEVDRISRDTEFNKKTLLNGSLDRRSYTDKDGIKVDFASNQVPANKYAITVTGMASRAEINANQMALVAGTSVTADMEGSIIINDYSVDISAGDSAEDVYAKIINACDRNNVKVEGFDTDRLSFSTYEYGSSETLTIEFTNDELATALGLTRSNKATGSDATAEFADGDTTQAGTQKVGFSETATISAYGNIITVTDIGGFELKYEVSEEYQAIDETVMTDVTDIGTMTVHIGANEGQVIDIRLQEVSIESLGLSNLNFLTGTGASKGISLLDKAITKVSSIRSEIGACQNRLDSATASLSVTKENMDSAISRIEDVNMAEEMSTYTQLNVLSQAGVSMVAQANEMPQMVLQLLQ
ncbi:MAG: flagellin [Lachnospiraceae bacterium]|nr:flagellin [Lachnospiraceae bacterium]